MPCSQTLCWKHHSELFCLTGAFINPHSLSLGPKKGNCPNDSTKVFLMLHFSIFGLFNLSCKVGWVNYFLTRVGDKPFFLSPLHALIVYAC